MHRSSRNIVQYLAICISLIVLALQISAQNAGAGKPNTNRRVERSRERTRRVSAAANRRAQKGKTVKPEMKFYGVSEPLRDIAARNLPPVSKENGPLQEYEPEPLYEEPAPKHPQTLLTTPVQTDAGPSFTGVLGTSFDSIAAGGVAPPDTTMAVGPNHIVVWVNSQYAVYNKAGALLMGPVNGNALFLGVGGNCELTNRGDPILQYDRLADRWILSQFAFSAVGNNPAAPYLQCFAISTTNDPTGAYFRYTVNFSSVAPSGLNDYGKLGVWPDGYYTSYNMFQGSPAGANSGVALCASDRVKMLVGDVSATTLCAPIAFYAGGGAFLPADLDGTTVPSDLSQGDIFIRFSTAPALRLIKLKPNYVAATVTLTDGFGGAAGSFINIATGATTRTCNGGAGTCIAQPGTATTLDTLGDRLMYRAAFRNRGGVESLVVAYSVDPDGAGAQNSAAQWYEIRSPLSAAPNLFQSATFNPGASGDRWMGSIAMNKDGDMMMGYSSVNSGTGLKPSIVLTGRRLTDAVNTMQTEQVVKNGLGSQTGGLTRWGDYTTIQVDPSDDRGFCFVGQYLPADGSFNWVSRVTCAAFPPPSAANVSISGRLMTQDGRGLGGLSVTITGEGGNVQTALTSPFGYYRFESVLSGQNYVLSVAAKRYSFASRMISVNDDLTGIDMIADPPSAMSYPSQKRPK